MTRKQIVAEILSGMRQYNEAGLIDVKTLNLDIKNELRRFGSLVTERTEDVVEVVNGFAELPEDFWSLYLAIKCTKEDSISNGDGSSSIVQDSQFYTQRTTSDYVWDNQSKSHNQVDYQTVEEITYLTLDNTAKVRYSHPVLLRLTKGVNRKYCTKDCKNLQLNLQSPYEINIIGDKIQTGANFRKGHIYLQYDGFPKDEETGDLLIPEVVNLEKYLVAYGKYKSLENLWLNGDDADLTTKVQYFRQEAQGLFLPAMTQIKMEGLGQQWANNYKRKIQKTTQRFERMFPNL